MKSDSEMQSDIKNRWLTLHLVALSILIQSACSNDGDKISNTTPKSSNFSREDAMSLVTGNIYYLDAVKGNDLNAGNSRTEAWQTLSKAQSTVVAGDAVVLLTGNYGDFIETAAAERDDWIIYINDENARPVFSRIQLQYPLLSDAYLIFYGIDIEVEWVEPGGDPQDPDSGLNTYTKTANPFIISNADSVQLHHGTLSGTNKHLTTGGVWIDNSRNVVINHNEITKVQRPVQMFHSENVSIINNHLHEMTSSCISYGNGCSHGLIEKNNCYDSNYSENEDYAPPETSADGYHASAIALRSGDVTIRNNIFHDGFTSSGIMFYSDATVSSFDNVLIENNLLYDIHNSVLRLYRTGSNVTVRNNTIIGSFNDGKPGIYQYYPVFILHSIAQGFDGAQVSIYNNIFVGITTFAAGAFAAGGDDVNEDGNIYWSMQKGTDWICHDELSTASIIITCEYLDNPPYFDSGFFNQDPVFSFAHSEFLDFTLAAGSAAIDFGIAEFQPPDSLGTLVDGFIQANNPSRDSAHHSAGCYEHE